MILVLLRRRRTRLFLVLASAWIAFDLIVGPILITAVTIPLLNELARRQPEISALLRSLLP